MRTPERLSCRWASTSAMRSRTSSKPRSDARLNQNVSTAMAGTAASTVTVARGPAPGCHRGGGVRVADGRGTGGAAPADAVVDADVGGRRARLRRGRLQPDEDERGEHRSPVGPEEATERERPSVVVDLAERDPL